MFIPRVSSHPPARPYPLPLILARATGSMLYDFAVFHPRISRRGIASIDYVRMYRSVHVLPEYKPQNPILDTESSNTVTVSESFSVHNSLFMLLHLRII